MSTTGFKGTIGFCKRLVPLVIQISRAYADSQMPSEQIWMRGRRRCSTCGNSVTASGCTNSLNC